MTETKKPIVPSLALDSAKLAHAPSEASTQAATESKHSLYTTRQATSEYVIRGMQEKPESVEGSQESKENQQEKKKRKRRKKKKNAQPPTGVKALKEDLDPSELYADSDQSEDEGIADYKIGGYHPVHIGEVMVERYVIL
jgi:hypothetical protein